ncbi:MAG: hypothetical protein JNM17_23755, partial [Archangium sp.]|nr:hypothetical protein [Archangium sp.]
GTYLFSFLAWQRIDQLVPPIVWEYWNALKVSLGYAAAPMPASYGAVYQALFISIGAVVAAIHFTRTSSRGAHVWLRTSAIAAGLSGMLAMISVGTDARPALVALPLLAAPMLGVGILTRRKDALLAGSGLTALLALVLQQKFTSGLPVMGLSLACAAAAFALSLGARSTRRLNRTARLMLASTALFSSALVTLVAVTQQGTDTFIALCGSSVAAIVAARFLHRRVLAAALFTAVAVLVRIQSPFVMGVTALALALLVLLPRRFRTAWRIQSVTPLTFALAFIAPAWAFTFAFAESVFGNSVAAMPVGLSSLLSAATFFLLARASKPGAGLLAMLRAKPEGVRAWLDGVAIVLLVNAVIPWSSNAGLFPGWSSLHAQLALTLFAVGSSVHAVIRGRSAQGVLLATLASLASFGISGGLLDQSGPVVWAWPALIIALSTAALLPSVTVPVAALFTVLSVQADPNLVLVLAVATALLALAEELDLTWNFVLNRARIAWSASITSALLFITALVFSAHGSANPPLMVLAVALPLVWMRATRQGFVAALAIPLFAIATALVAPGLLSLTPVLAVVLTRTLTWNRVRAFIGLPELKRSDIEGFAFVGAAAFTALLSIVTQRGLEAPWAAALLVMGGGAGVLRVLIAACFAGLNPELRPLTVGGLVGIAALTHHAPRALRTMLGSRSVAWVEITSLVLAVAGAVLSVLGAASVPQLSPLTFSVAVAVALVAGLLATFSRAWSGRRVSDASAGGQNGSGSARTVRYPSAIVACLATGLAVAAMPVTWLLPATLIIAAVLLGAPVLLSAAGLTLGLNLLGTLHAGVPVLDGNVHVIALVLAGLSVALRFTRVDEVVSTWWRKLGREGDWSRASSLFWPALVLCVMSLPSLAVQSWPVVYFPLAALLVTPRRHEQAATWTVLALATLWLFPMPVVTACFALGGLTLATLGRFVEHRLAGLWKVSAWVFAFVALCAAGVEFGSWTVPFAWLAAVAVTWLQVGHTATGRGWAWGATGVGVHVVMAFVGVRLSTGAPMVLIFPWWAAGSVALALLRHFRGGTRSATAFSIVSLVELMSGVVLLHSAQPREAVLSVLVAIALVFIAWRRIVESDDSLNAWLGQFALVGGALAARILGSGAMPGLTEAWVLLGASAVFAGLSQFLKREGRPAAGGVLSIGAWAWPALGAVLVPWTQWTAASIWLVGVSLLGAWFSRTTARRAGTLVSAAAINAALVLAGIGMGFSEWHLRLVPFGLTLLALAWLFRDEVSVRSQILLRAWGMGFVYAAMAWKPLTANSVGAMVLCVTVCLVGIGIGALWRIRSYVLLGSGVLVTTVLATLVRSGLAEPRLGAVFLSLLGLLVVVVMVLITTRRDELRERMASMQRVMATWSP